MDSALFWIVGGFALVIVEFFFTSFIVVFFGLAAILVGLALWSGVPAHSGIPYVLFAVLSLGLLFGLRARCQQWFVGSLAEVDSDDDFIGAEVKIISGFDTTSPGRGRVSYRGAQWDARSASAQLDVGSFAKIIARKSALLEIEAES